MGFTDLFSQKLSQSNVGRIAPKSFEVKNHCLHAKRNHTLLFGHEPSFLSAYLDNLKQEK